MREGELDHYLLLAAADTCAGLQAILRPFSKPKTKADRAVKGTVVIAARDDEEEDDETEDVPEEGDESSSDDEDDDLASGDESDEDDNDEGYELDADQAASDAAFIDKLEKANRKRFQVTEDARKLGQKTLSNVSLTDVLLSCSTDI